MATSLRIRKGCKCSVPVLFFDGHPDDWEDGVRRSERLFPETWETETYAGTVQGKVTGTKWTVRFADGDFDVPRSQITLTDPPEAGGKSVPAIIERATIIDGHDSYLEGSS